MIVFMKMEERRMGYIALKLRKEHKALSHQLRMREIQLAKTTRPQRLDDVAQNQFLLQRTQAEQIIQLSDKVKIDFSKLKKDL